MIISRRRSRELSSVGIGISSWGRFKLHGKVLVYGIYGIDWQVDAWPRLLMVIVTPLTNQGVCWAYYGRSRERSVLFPNIQREAGSSGKLVEET